MRQSPGRKVVCSALSSEVGARAAPGVSQEMTGAVPVYRHGVMIGGAAGVDRTLGLTLTKGALYH